MLKTKKYSLTNEDISRIFGYSNVNSFNNSTAKDRILKAVEKLIKHVEQSIIKKIES